MNSSAVHTVIRSGAIAESKDPVEKQMADANTSASGSLGFARNGGMRA